MVEINGITIYSITGDALNTYITQAKRGRNALPEVIKLKLSALIHAVPHVETFVTMNGQRRIKHTFAGFNIVTVDDVDMITWIDWDSDDHVSKSYINKVIATKLKQTYQALGLSNSGDSFKVIKD